MLHPWTSLRTGILFLVLIIGGCQSVQEKNLNLVRDRVEKLKPLSTWTATWCRVEAEPTQPALARYREMYPDEGVKQALESWAYTWKARETSCEVRALEVTPMIANQKSFLDTAFCLLLQSHFVNSPFDELKILPEAISLHDGKVQIQTSADPSLGLFLDSDAFKIETRTKSHGTFEVLYTEQKDHRWLPSRLEQRLGNSKIVLDSIEYGANPIGGREIVQSFWLNIGGEQPVPHTHVKISGCQTY